jgi:glycosyltransferase involved in cell wall biosynthesis
MRPAVPPRILEIISGFAVEGPLGGIERFGIELTRQLVRRDAHPILCGMWDYGTSYESSWVDRLTNEGIEAFIAATWDETAVYPSFLQAVRGMARSVKKPVDIIHSHCQFGDMAALLLARPLGAKVLIRTVHNEREWPKRPHRRWLLTNGLFPVLFRAELGVSQQVVTNLDRRPLARLLKRRGIYLPNALDFGRFEQLTVDRMAKRRELGVPIHAPVVGSIGRLTRQKGYDVLLDAVPYVAADIADVHFVIVGSGEDETMLRDRARALGIQDRVTFTGSRSDIEAVLGSFDLFVSSSLWEGLPTVILESMAARVPVVGTRVSGTTELIHHKESGLLVEAGNPPALAEGIVMALQDPVQARQRAQRAYLSSKKRFSISAVADAHLKLYQEKLSIPNG